MLEQTFTKPFKKQYKLMQKQGREINKLIEVMKMIADEQPLSPKYCNHQLHGEWEGAQDCHIQGDWVLIYEVDKAAGKVIFHRTGTHADLF